MQNAQWSQLRQRLLDRGWTVRDDTLYAPHETLWFTDAAHPDLVAFRDQVSDGAERVGTYIESHVDHTDVHEDLVSLVHALDDVLEN
ncbi:MAG TPA: hypothetical protein VLM79_04500 [Kofleriaceae bacterium]|nr:hypothetical protein [Kofleriaceae bacterium]